MKERLNWQIEHIEKPRNPRKLGGEALSAVSATPEERRATIETDDQHLKALSKRYPNITDIKELRGKRDGI